MSEAREFRRFYSALPEASALLSFQGRLLALNEAACELFQRTEASVAGARLHELVSDGTDKVDRFLRFSQRNGQLMPAALNFVSPGGALIPCRVEGALLKPAGTDRPGVLLARAFPKEWATRKFVALNEQIEALHRELATHKRTEAQLQAQRAALQRANASLRRANFDLEQFAYSASHDLQEPLRMVAIYSQLLKKKFGGQLGAIGDEYIRYTVEGSTRMEQLVSGLLAYARASSGGEDRAETADANQALDHAVASLQAAIQEAGTSLTRAALPQVRMRPVHLEQLFQNLLSNAIKYRDEHPSQVCVKAERQDGDWLFSVQDNGIGIGPEFKEHVFGLFKRLHPAEEYPGAGMGLAICRRIVEQAGGHIWVESEPGRGATFFFTVPAIAAGEGIP